MRDRPVDKLGAKGTIDSKPVETVLRVPVDGQDWRLLAELFTILKRAGAGQIITYAAASLAATLG